MGPVTALAGVCLQDVERGAHEGGKRQLASRLRPVSSKATHPPTYLPLHTIIRLKCCTSVSGGSPEKLRMEVLCQEQDRSKVGAKDIVFTIA